MTAGPIAAGVANGAAGAVPAAVGSPAAATLGDTGSVGSGSSEMPGVAGQLVQVLSPPRLLANGTYTVTVTLHPESLGTVQATVIASDARLSVQLVASTNDAADAIRQGLSELHEALSSGGQPATVTVSGGGAQGGNTGARAGGAPFTPGQFSGHGDARPQGDSPADGGLPRPASAVPLVQASPGQPAKGGRGEGRLLDVHV